jgi:hypothetical protein
MFIDSYYSEQDGNITFTRDQGSDFAKRVADDFNPLHDAGASRFCIPGDLLFAIILSRYGLSRHMEFIFSGMVLEGIELVLPQPGNALNLDDIHGKHYLGVNRSGDITTDETLIHGLTRNYVEFSGHTFPHILVPLLAEQGLMINPNRPMVIYQSMVIDLDTLDMADPVLEIDHNELTTDGKRGNVSMAFNFLSAGQVVGRGEKHMVLGGLREYEEQAMTAAILRYNERKMAFAMSNG